MKNFKPSMIKAALITSGFAFGAGSALAQEANTEEEANDVEVIQVSGIRGSLMRAQALKMDNTSIVEALSAEDIGKLPDTSVAESLARLPGLAGERRAGRTSGLSIRGFNENFIGTTLNGRELLGMGDNRGVEFDLYPSEIVSNVLVYKTPEAGMVTQGVGGTIDFQTIRPLGKDRSLTVNLNYEENGKESGNPDYDNNGHRFSLNYVDSFADDTLGLALVIASLETPRQEEQFRGWGYANVNTGSARRADDTVTASGSDVVLGGHDSFVRSSMLERDSVAAVVQWAPTDKLMIQFDALYIDFLESDVKRGLEEGGAEWGVGDQYTITGIDNGLVTSGFYDGFYSVIRNDGREQDAELSTFGLNLEYQINDFWTATLDLSVSDSEKRITDIESYSGVGRAGIDGRPLSARSWVMTDTGAVFSDHPTIAPVDLTDPSLIRLAGPQPWGGSLAPVPELQGVPGFAPNTAQDGFVNEPLFDESLDAFRLEFEGVGEWGIFSKFKGGVTYQERSKTKINGGAYLTAPAWPDDDPIPDVLGVADLGFIGIEGVLAYDSLGLYKSGYYREWDASDLETGRWGDSYTVEEEILTVFAKMDIDTEVGGMFLTGNVGVQVVRADQSARGWGTFTGNDLYVELRPQSGEAQHTDILPTLNLRLEVAEDQFMRMGVSRVLTRPRMDDMRPNNQVSFAFNDSNILAGTLANSPWSGSSGNPMLEPIASQNFDLAYENYFAEDGYVAVSFFYKDLKNWHEGGRTVADFSNFYIPGYHDSSGNHDIDGDGILDGPLPPQTFEGFVDYRQDGLTGFVRGWEVQTNLPFSVFADELEGFGIVASATFLDGELDDGSRIPGLSEESYSFTAYYENSGFEIRVSGTKRDEFLTEVRGLSLALGPTTDQGGEQWDAQIGYDFSESGIEALEGLRVTLQGQNLTDEATIQANGVDSRQITQYQTFGRNFLLGINYEF